ncbi:MAG: DUF6502 family protein [Steroidobacteraceae bacterium]|jgi:hypothetical protein
MKKQQASLSKPRSPAWTGARNGGISTLRAVTVDDVVRDLLALFGSLGLDAGHLINRVNYVDHTRRGWRQSSRESLAQLSTMSDLLSLWHQDPSFVDSAGNPLPLKMSGRGISFRRIAAIAVPGIPAPQLLGELKRLRAVRVDSKGLIHARMRALSIYEDKRLAALHTLNSLRGFINTLHHNLGSPPANSDQLFHRIAWNGDFDRRKLPELKIWLRRHGQNLLESVDIWMMSQAASRPAKRAKKAVQASVGLYLSVDEP